ncbi:MAG: lysophospholipid acyltransferase family protein [Bryobacteraceae bacterium]
MLTKLRTYLWIVPGIALSTIACGSVSAIVALFDHSSRAQIRMARIWARSLLWIVGVKVEVEGIEKVRGIEQCVWASNHVSYMDTPVMLAYIPVQFFFLAKSELFKIPFMGWHLHRAGHVSVPIDDPKASLRTLANAAKLLNEREVALLFFPEGGRSESGELQEFKDGAAYIAIKAQVPLVPMALLGIRDILPMNTLDFKRGTVKLRFGTPIPTAGLTAHARAEITTLCRAQIVDMLKR